MIIQVTDGPDAIDGLAKAMRELLSIASDYGAARLAASTQPDVERVREIEQKSAELLLQRSAAYFEALAKVGDQVKHWTVGLDARDGEQPPHDSRLVMFLRPVDHLPSEMGN